MVTALPLPQAWPPLTNLCLGMFGAIGITSAFWGDVKRRSQRVFDLAPEQLNIVLVDEADLIMAEGWIAGCESCMEAAHLPLDYLLDAMTGSNPLVTEYLLPRPARCPRCSAGLTEKMAVRLD